MNVDFSLNVVEYYLKSLVDNDGYAKLREASKSMIVPSLEELSCNALTNIVSIKKPKRVLEIGCGIGVSTESIVRGFKGSKIISIDSNLERITFHRSYFQNYVNVETVQSRAEAWLEANNELFDFVFVDSVKREYPNIWLNLQRHLADDAVVVFDDIMLYGYVACDTSEVPNKYQSNVHELQNFLVEIFSDKSLNTQIIPVGNGLLTISKLT